MVIKDDSLSFWIAVFHTPNINVKRYKILKKFFPDPSQIFKTSQAQLIKLGLGEKFVCHLLQPDWQSVENTLSWVEKENHYFLSYEDERYPNSLKEIYSPPLGLFVHGDVDLLKNKQIAIVGSRNPTSGGKEDAYRFANCLAREQFTITSGMALGIDTASHQGAMAATSGKTIAVIGTGIDRVYPARNKSLAYKIAEQGVIVTEFPLGTQAHARNFPKRNRIISGLSLGVLVVEATFKSGSLITAKYALEQNREVFAIPGSIHNPLARGCHSLLRQGATLVETAYDILQEIGGMTNLTSYGNISNNNEETLDRDYQNLVNCIDYQATPIDCIVERSGMPAQTVASKLLVLEVKGYVSAVSGGYTRKVKSNERRHA